ncbi:1765_t:CDS:2 [Funneliformis caledonium]|uniref:1765_t:CDS:1 n=1 Tax=Funneliformis caledonium TaxID=1117310 RepID=A0A9N9HCE7_9GLOM|nr:1765_t:CDS:2 [Funneliformis caledonium]
MSRTFNPSNLKAFFTSLNNLHMINNLDLIKNHKSINDLITYETNTGSSTIDHIFMHSSLIPDLIDQVVTKVDNDLSDHAFSIDMTRCLMTTGRLLKSQSINDAKTQNSTKYAATKTILNKYTSHHN